MVPLIWKYIGNLLEKHSFWHFFPPDFQKRCFSWNKYGNLPQNRSIMLFFPPDFQKRCFSWNKNGNRRKSTSRIEEGAPHDHRSRRDSYLLVLFFFRRNYFLFFSFSSPVFPDGTSTPWRSGCSCLRRRTCLSSCPVSCSR